MRSSKKIAAWMLAAAIGNRTSRRMRRQLGKLTTDSGCICSGRNNSSVNGDG